MSNQLFIVGAPRSGTSFLASLLEATPYGAPVETHFILKMHDQIERYGDLSVRRNFHRLIDDILKVRAVRQWKLQIDKDALYDSMNGNFDFAAIADAVCLERARNDGLDDSWGDKTPWYLEQLGTLIELFPNARYIYIVRDGRDVALSLLRKKWGPNNFYAAAKYWKQLNHDQHHLESLQSKNRLFRLSYEQLLQDPATVIGNLFDFLGCELPRAEQDRALNRTMKNNWDKWKTQMNDRQIRVFESVAGETLELHGYELKFPGARLGAMSRLAYELHDRIKWLLFMFETNVVDTFKIRYMGKEPFAE